MPNNLIEQIREWDEQVVHCARQADAQTDPKVKQQFLELKRLWLLLARSCDGHVSDVAETDEDALTFDIPDDALERAAGAPPLITLVPCTFHWPDCAWPQ